MRHFVAILLAAAIGAVCSLQAQQYEIGVAAAYPRLSKKGIGTLAGAEGTDEDTRVKGLRGAGIRLTMNTPGYYGHEIGYFMSEARVTARVPEAGENDAAVINTRQDKVRVHQVSYNFLMYFMPAGERWRPFFAAGAAMDQYQAPSIPGWLGGKSRKFGPNYGGGLKLKLAKHALFRLDFRHTITGKPYDLDFADIQRAGGLFHQLQGSAGLSITF